MSKRMIAKILSLWKKGKNVWEISQITGVPEPEVMRIVQAN